MLSVPFNTKTGFHIFKTFVYEKFYLNCLLKMDSSGFEPEASPMPRGRSSADLRAQSVLWPALQLIRANKIYGCNQVF